MENYILKGPATAYCSNIILACQKKCKFTHLTCRLLGGLVLTGSIDRNTIPLVFVSPDDTEYKKIKRVKFNHI